MNIYIFSGLYALAMGTAFYFGFRHGIRWSIKRMVMLGLIDPHKAREWVAESVSSKQPPAV
jgi:hypothetical protein